MDNKSKQKLDPMPVCYTHIEIEIKETDARLAKAFAILFSEMEKMMRTKNRLILKESRIVSKRSKPIV